MTKGQLLSSVRVEMRSSAQLRVHPHNARTHSKRQIQQVANSIKAVGFLGAIIVDEGGTVLAGHARLAGSKLLGMELVPTITARGLSEAQKRAFLLGDNKIAENAGWDRQLLAGELIELSELLPLDKLSLDLTGFEPAEVDLLLADHGLERPDPADDIPSPWESPITRRGEMWRCGLHRVLCGDARSRADLERLMDGMKARMAFTDPTYNRRVADIQGRGQIKHDEFAFASGEMSDAEYVAFLRESLGNLARSSADGALHYVCMDWRHIGDLLAAAKDVYDLMLNICVWAKTNAGQGSFYRSQHELIGVFRVGSQAHLNNVQLGRFGRNRSNLWTYQGINSFAAARLDTLKLHPTVKPVTLVADAMRDCTAKGDVVLDGFMGSGTLCLAAEKIGRRGYGIEYEPKFVDVAIRRWQSFTKSDAILDGDGRTFSEIAAERIDARAKTNSSTVEEPRVPVDQTEGDWTRMCDEVLVTSSKESGK